MNKDKKKINPLYIKDANLVMCSLVTNILLLHWLNHYQNSFTKFVVILIEICSVLGITFGLIICAGWLVAIYTKNVIYIENKPQGKGNNKNGNDNH